MPLALRDKALLNLRRQHFGDTLDVVTTCPECDAELEFALDLDAVIAAISEPKEAVVDAGGQSVSLRPLTSSDLAAAAGAPATDIARVIRARLAGEVPSLLCDAVDAEIEARAEEAELRLALTCADCGASWSDPLDVATHVWSEFDVLAHRTLGDVAELARAFGWSEDQSLALGPRRRAAYLDLARAGA